MDAGAGGLSVKRGACHDLSTWLVGSTADRCAVRTARDSSLQDGKNRGGGHRSPAGFAIGKNGRSSGGRGKERQRLLCRQRQRKYNGRRYRSRRTKRARGRHYEARGRGN